MRCSVPVLMPREILMFQKTERDNLKTNSSSQTQRMSSEIYYKNKNKTLMQAQLYVQSLIMGLPTIKYNKNEYMFHITLSQVLHLITALLTYLNIFDFFRS